jgi:integral membrane protein 2B
LIKNDDGDLSDDEAESLHNVLKQMLERFQREFNDPMKEIRSMESEISSLNPEMIKNNWFKEEVEVKDDDKESYADIKIPDFKDGRQGRFIHDFKNNQTTIVDESAKRCFIYPLDYATTLPPKSMADVFVKMQTGYYFPDTNELRKKMRVVLPALSVDDDDVSEKTAFSCTGMNIYRLESFVSGVYKRSIPEELDDHGKFAVFSGSKLVIMNLVNIDEVEQQEKSKR